MTGWRKRATKNPLGGGSGSFSGGPHKIVLHSTETGDGWPGYAGGSVAPHETWKWNSKTARFDIRQHIRHDQYARALVNKSGGAQTNRDSAHQIEIVGSCDFAFARKHGYNYLPGMSDAFLVELGKELRLLAKDTGTSLVVTSRWERYPNSYGAGGQRFGYSHWDAFSGICGHQHVPENLHGDPGNLDVVKALRLSALKPAKVTGRPAPVKPSRSIPERLGLAPRFPLPAGHSFGPKDGPARHHSGYYGADDRAQLRRWQAQMRKRGWKIDVDGFYGNQTRAAALDLQTRHGSQEPNGLIGPKTWAWAWSK